jgi:hypothetical protein
MTSQLLNPPKPPTLHEPGCLLLASSGFYIRFHEDGSASLVDGIQDITLADFTSAEIEGIAYGLNNKGGKHKMSWMDDGGFEIKTFARNRVTMARMSFRTSTGNFDVTLSKTEVQRIKRECNRILKELEASK